VWRDESPTERRRYVQTYAQGRKGIVEKGVWRLILVSRNNVQGIRSTCSKGERWKHLFMCGGKLIWRDEVLDKKFRNIDLEKGARKMVVCKNKEQL
jgi:hypothetical protein